MLRFLSKQDILGASESNDFKPFKLCVESQTMAFNLSAGSSYQNQNISEAVQWDEEDLQSYDTLNNDFRKLNAGKFCFCISFMVTFNFFT